MLSTTTLEGYEHQSQEQFETQGTATTLNRKYMSVFLLGSRNMWD